MHDPIEEKIFYPSVMTGETRDQLIEATEEHLAVKRLLADMLELDCEDEHFDAKLTLRTSATTPTTRRRTSCFRRSRRCWTTSSPLGNELLAMFESLLEGSPRNNVSAETRRAAELHV